MSLLSISAAAGVARPVQVSRASGSVARNAVFFGARRAVPRISRSTKIQAVLTADAALDVSKMAPLGDRILVKPKEAEEKTAGGILLASPSTPKMDDAHIGTVVAVGEDVDVGVAVGDMVLFTKYGSSDIEVPNGEVCFVAQKSILAKLS